MTIAAIVAISTAQSSAARPVTMPTGSATRTRRSRRARAQRSADRSGPSAPRTAAARRGAASSFVPRAPGEQVGEQPVGAGDAGGQLAEEHEAGVDVAALAVARDEQRSEERRVGEECRSRW